MWGDNTYLELGPLQLISRGLQRWSNIPLCQARSSLSARVRPIHWTVRTFEDVAILQLLSVRTLSEAFLQSLKSF